jgi:hypothetical protein
VAPTVTHSYVLRDTFTSVVFWFAVALGVVLAGDPLIRGDFARFATTTPIVGLVLWALAMLLLHPHIRYDDQQVVVTNIGRIHEIPWSRVVTVRQNLNLMFELDNGRRIGATGVTAPRDKGLVLAGLTRGKMGVNSADFHRNADALRPVQAAATPTSDQVVSRWDVVPLAIGAALVVAVAVVVVVDLAVQFSP